VCRTLGSDSGRWKTCLVASHIYCAGIQIRPSDTGLWVAAPAAENDRTVPYEFGRGPFASKALNYVFDEPTCCNKFNWGLHVESGLGRTGVQQQRWDFLFFDISGNVVGGTCNGQLVFFIKPTTSSNDQGPLCKYLVILVQIRTFRLKIKKHVFLHILGNVI
jgi:hypothetical protein